jgi:hypothetical protein
LGREKFQADIAQLSANELGRAQQFASFSESDIPTHHLTGKIHREHRARLVEKGVLIRTGRGRYKLVAIVQEGTAGRVLGVGSTRFSN